MDNLSFDFTGFSCNIFGSCIYVCLDILQSVKEERNIPHTGCTKSRYTVIIYSVLYIYLWPTLYIKRGKANWVGRFLRRNCLLEHDIEGRLEGTRRRRRCKQLLYDLEEAKSYWQLQEEVVYRTAENCVSRRLWVPQN
jgi:hypothetical protein